MKKKMTYYHVSDAKNEESIMKHGLRLTKATSRIYGFDGCVFLSDSINYALCRATGIDYFLSKFSNSFYNLGLNKIICDFQFIEQIVTVFKVDMDGLENQIKTYDHHEFVYPHAIPPERIYIYDHIDASYYKFLRYKDNYQQMIEEYAKKRTITR